MDIGTDISKQFLMAVSPKEITKMAKSTVYTQYTHKNKLNLEFLFRLKYDGKWSGIVLE